MWEWWCDNGTNSFYTHTLEVVFFEPLRGSLRVEINVFNCINDQNTKQVFNYLQQNYAFSRCCLSMHKNVTHISLSIYYTYTHRPDISVLHEHTLFYCTASSNVF
jgi:hypothetical protein